MLPAPTRATYANGASACSQRLRARAAPLLPQLLLGLMLLAAAPTAQAYIQVLNNCGYAVTAFWRAGASTTYNRKLLPGESTQITLPNGVWIAGVVWGSRTGSINNGQATQLEFTIGADVGGGKKQDFYDVSVINAYNTPARIRPLNPPSISGAWCGSPSCVISGLNSFCTTPNFLAGADPACINRDGPGLLATSGTRAFKSKCPTAYTYSKDDTTSMFSCKWGTNYEVKFCP
ncbi:hypothetical protein HYH02_000478 [Chlamydomonas schloesseri]|uniref:Thaumatin-like protein n=1 Tax=Chlamydomonas schloesseri TaxID=2026947 RepID=A0A835WWU1_9CHLO|nr:hypothetical protein HYH02_000478 [Chlamydomonas schloesseri]|eukprot:KAG2454638.1 hypothetical protein HYH02_000478 [Chlamydomonas schloesseri]